MRWLLSRERLSELNCIHVLGPKTDQTSLTYPQDFSLGLSRATEGRVNESVRVAPESGRVMLSPGPAGD